MSRIAERFAALKAQGRKALIPYVTAGDPDLDATLALLHVAVANGADILEIGVPFSDPMADGPVIQAACERALKHHVSMIDVFSLVRRFREQDTSTPVVLMGYLNPIEVMGYAAFAAAAAEVGVDGVLTVDAPPEESAGLVTALVAKGLDPIYLIAPTSTPERIKKICAAARGFVYYVSLKGVTGSAQLDTAAVSAKLKEIRQVTSLPIGVGFGISDADSASAVATVADAVVVGSAVIKQIESRLEADQGTIVTAVGDFIASLRAGVDRGSDPTNV